MIFALGALVLRVSSGLWSPLAEIFDPLLIVAVLAALPGRPGAAISAGLLTGALADTWSARWWGEHAFTNMVIAFFIAQLARRVDLIEPLPAAACLAVGTVAAWAIPVGLSALFGTSVGALPGWTTWGLAALLNTVVGMIAHRGLRRRDMLG